MNKINISFKKNSYEYKLMARTDMAVLYSMFKHGSILGYEVHKVRVIPECIVFSKLIPTHEKLPGNEEFGKYGWPYQHKKNAMAKYKEIGGI